ncbi:MAG: pilus assembly PilX N-terminal domain-containing protein [candidate division WOR-3 bacterium]|nr:pilus assembly PilX N-terminal domain-containing protein [candidate division WOR-3 bacterium]
MNKKFNKNKGISMIIVLWIITILTVLVTATALMTTSDVSSTLNLVKRKEALQLAESGSDLMLSMIPMNSMIRDSIIGNSSLYFEGIKDTVHRVYLDNDSTKSFALKPIPMIYNNAYGVNPYASSPGGGGTYYVYEFNTAGIIGKESKGPQKLIQVAGAWWTPVGVSTMGHTMY